MVLMKWMGCRATRHQETFMAVQPPSTRSAPRSDSKIKKPNDQCAARRTRSPGRVTRLAQTTIAATISSARPLVARCVNSMTVSICCGRGITSPLQIGQCSPHPAPEPVALTIAPPTTTSTLNPSANQAILL